MPSKEEMIAESNQALTRMASRLVRESRHPIKAQLQTKRPDEVKKMTRDHVVKALHVQLDKQPDGRKATNFNKVVEDVKSGVDNLVDNLDEESRAKSV